MSQKPLESGIFDPERPYNELSRLPPSQDIKTPAILEACIKAARALAELNGVSQKLPDPQILLITLPLQEARGSSAIENIMTTTSKLFEAMALDKKDTDPQTKEVLRYRQAMEMGQKQLTLNQLLTTRLFEEICTELQGSQMQVRAIPGTRLENAQTKKIIYTPPEGEARLRELLANLEEFIHKYENIDPLIKMAVIHYQFEAIHPFHDGNGRTGRILNILYLMQQNLLTQPILYLSSYFIKNRDSYYEKIALITQEQEWEQWILYILKAIETTAQQTSRQIEEIGDLFNSKLEYAKTIMSNAYVKEMLELVFTRPYVQIEPVMNHLGVSRQTATKYLRDWERAQLLSSLKIGRELLFINDDLLKIFIDIEDGGDG